MIKNRVTVFISVLLGVFLILPSLPSVAQHVPLAPVSEKKNSEMDSSRNRLKHAMDVANQYIVEYQTYLKNLNTFVASEDRKTLLSEAIAGLNKAKEIVDPFLNQDSSFNQAKVQRSVATTHAKMVDQFADIFSKMPLNERKNILPALQAFYKTYLDANKKADDYDYAVNKAVSQAYDLVIEARKKYFQVTSEVDNQKAEMRKNNPGIVID